MRAIVVTFDDVAYHRVDRECSQSIRPQSSMLSGESQPHSEPETRSPDQLCFEGGRESLEEDMRDPCGQTDPRPGQCDLADIVQQTGLAYLRR